MQGLLFIQDFLLRGICETPPFRDFSAERFARFHAALQEVFQGIAAASALNEAQTEEQIIDKTLAALGWDSHSLPQVNM
ncbi:MAG: hypothetical protein LBG69_04160, partial [Zoogloeaceae bacterium]|nr:hypothetical protein [Zoogloeaceae bacterium]